MSEKTTQGEAVIDSTVGSVEPPTRGRMERKGSRLMSAAKNSVHPLVVCCKACGECRHGQPHEPETHGNQRCTQWGDCHRADGRLIRVRCTTTHNAQVEFQEGSEAE